MTAVIPAGARVAVAASAAAALAWCGVDQACAQAAPPATAATNSAAAATSQPGLPFTAQATYTEQETDGFHSPYAGTNSLSPDSGRETTDATLYLGARLWRGAELWINPEADEGFGLDDTLGLAGFSSGEAYKVGRNAPYFRLQRAFIRQTVNLGGEVEQCGRRGPTSSRCRSPPTGWSSPSASSVSSTSSMSTATRTTRARDFLNWSVIDAGTFDYAADAWGYTAGGAAEWYVGPWAWRAGVFDLSDVPNSTAARAGLRRISGRPRGASTASSCSGEPGKIDVTMFESRGRMALLQDAIAYGDANGLPPQLSRRCAATASGMASR